MTRSRLSVVRAVAVLLPALLLAVPAPAAPTASALPQAASTPRVTPRDDAAHRVVWDASRRQGAQTVIMSANPDGSDRREVYRRARGWVLQLPLDPAGRRLALAPWSSRVRGTPLVVVDVVTGRSRTVLTRDSHFDSIGAVDWSRSGRRLVFEGYSGSTDHRRLTLWTVRPDGTGLHRLYRFWAQDEWSFSRALPWTARGVVVTTRRGVEVLDHGRSTLVLRNAAVASVSGDRRWLFVFRGVARTSLWRVRPDGSGLHPVIRDLDPERRGFLSGFAADQHGRFLLTRVEAGDGSLDAHLTIHPTTRPPRASDPRLPRSRDIYLVAWS